MILDKYFKNPFFWDCLIAIVFSLAAFLFVDKKTIIIPDANECISVTTDIINISLTMSGFILTLLTVLITFKGSSKITKIENDSKESIFEIFFATTLYHETVKHLKNCIRSLILIAILGFAMKLFSPESFKKNLFFFNIIGFSIIIMTTLRCLLILNKVMELQKESDENNQSN